VFKKVSAVLVLLLVTVGLSSCSTVASVDQNPAKKMSPSPTDTSTNETPNEFIDFVRGNYPAYSEPYTDEQLDGFSTEVCSGLSSGEAYTSVSNRLATQITNDWGQKDTKPGYVEFLIGSSAFKVCPDQMQRFIDKDNHFSDEKVADISSEVCSHFGNDGDYEHLKTQIWKELAGSNKDYSGLGIDFLIASAVTRDCPEYTFLVIQ
jgi:hypothetical protein